MDFVIVEQYNAILLLVWLLFVIIFSLLSKLCNTHGLCKNGSRLSNSCYFTPRYLCTRNYLKK